MRITLTKIYVDDQEKALGFYTDVLPYALQYAGGTAHAPGTATPASEQAQRRGSLRCLAPCLLVVPSCAACRGGVSVRPVLIQA